jgi:hypothetical protein
MQPQPQHHSDPSDRRDPADQLGESAKPHWVDALEESLLLAIGLFSLITWIVMLGLLSH